MKSFFFHFIMVIFILVHNFKHTAKRWFIVIVFVQANNGSSVKQTCICDNYEPPTWPTWRAKYGRMDGRTGEAGGTPCIPASDTRRGLVLFSRAFIMLYALPCDRHEQMTCPKWLKIFRTFQNWLKWLGL